MAEDTGDLTAEQVEETIADERPDWLPENFATPQDLVTSYKEAQRRVTELGTTNARDREQIEQYEEMLTARQEPQAQFDPTQHPLVMGAQSAFDNGDALGFMAAMRELNKLDGGQEQQPTGLPLTAYTAEQLRLQTIQRYDADEELQAKAREIMETDPYVASQFQQLMAAGTPTVEAVAPLMDLSYRLAARDAETLQRQSLAQQQQEQERSRQRKIEQEGLTGGGPTRAPSANEQAEAWERIKNVDPGTMPRVNPN